MKASNPKNRSKIIFSITGVLFLLLAVGVVLWVRKFPRYTPVEVMLDLRAAAATKGSARPVETFLENRYGPLTDPVNRRKAFLDFFNPGHIEGLNLLVTRMSAVHRQTNITAMANWVADYRRTLSPEEKKTLRDYFQSGAGQKQLQRGTARYLEQDAHYRAATAPVISELMTTVTAVKQP